jgi:hypothetical protein
MPKPHGADPQDSQSPRRTRTTRPFPMLTFTDAMELANAIQEYSGGAPIRRITLFDQLGRSPDSGSTRQLITNSSKYGITEGGYQADVLSLTDDGVVITSEESSQRDKAGARIRLAIQKIEPFNALYERFCGNKLPSKAVLIDAIKESGVSSDVAEEGVDIFVVNARDVGLLMTLSGADRLVSIDHLLESLPSTSNSSLRDPLSSRDNSLITKHDADFARTCFYITPIGSDGSDERMHSDLFLGSIVEPALDSFDLRVVRADAIEKPGLITKQVIEYLLKSRLVVADLSFHNPNVFYELAIRHAARLPTVQIIRSQDRIPFDVNQNRTVQIDCSTIYSLVPQIESYKSQIANHVRRALDDADSSDNPITLFCPNLKVSL